MQVQQRHVDEQPPLQGPVKLKKKQIVSKQYLDLSEDWDLILVQDECKATELSLHGREVFVPVDSKQAWLPQLEVQYGIEHRPEKPMQVFVIKASVHGIPGIEEYRPHAMGIWCCPLELALMLSKGNPNALVIKGKKAKALRDSHDVYKDASKMYIKFKSKMQRMQRLLSMFGEAAATMVSSAPLLALLMS